MKTILTQLQRRINTTTVNIVLAMITFLVCSCTIVNYPNQQTQLPSQTSLQQRQYQQREFDTNNIKLVMKAVLNSLQDDGFTVKNAVVDLGLISATKEITLRNNPTNATARTGDDFWSALFRDAVFGNRQQNTAPANQNQRAQNLKQIEATVNVSEFGKQTRVRTSFQARILDTDGGIMESYPITDMKFYQEFFEKVDKGVFIEKQKF